MLGNQEVDMLTNKILKAGWVVLVVLTLLAFRPMMAGATAPGNDDIASATVISALPFSDTPDTSEATASLSDPYSECTYNYLQATVWYVFTPSQDVLIETSTAGSSYSTVMQIFSGSPENLSYFGCVAGSGSLFAKLVAGTSYYFVIGANPAYPPPEGSSWGGSLVFNLSQVMGPANDNFADATIVDAIPFFDSVYNLLLSREAGEPVASCTPSYSTPGGSLWYAYTATSAEPISVHTVYSGVQSVLAIYQGSSLQDLVELACNADDYGGEVRLRPETGKIYYFQISKVYDYQDGYIYFAIDPIPPLQASFYYYPEDPSRYDTVSFYDSSWDPEYIGIQTENWDFGDGSTGSGCCPSHQYAADGDYTVNLVVTTFDGRSASASQPLSVRTHDVAITRFNTPQSAKAGQTRAITVGINDKSNAETVEVQLYRSTPGGWVYFASLTQYVPPRSANRTTDFNFSYTFTPEDASYGKVSFRALANIQGGRDAFPADNEAISTPVKVSR
jgi:PKD domain